MGLLSVCVAAMAESRRSCSRSQACTGECVSVLWAVLVGQEDRRWPCFKTDPT